VSTPRGGYCSPYKKGWNDSLQTLQLQSELDSLLKSQADLFKHLQFDETKLIHPSPLPKYSLIDVESRKGAPFKLNNILFYVLFIMVAVIEIAFPRRWQILFLSIIQPKYVYTIDEEDKLGFNLHYIVCDLATIYTISKILFITYEVDINITFEWFTLVVAIVYYLKALVILSVGEIFFRDGSNIRHLLAYFGFIRPTGLIVFFGIFFFSVVFPNSLMGSNAIYLFSIWYILTFLAVFRGLWDVARLGFAQSTFVFIYLCTTEITPVIIALRDFIE